MQPLSPLILILLLPGAPVVVQGFRVLGVFSHPAPSNALFCHSVMSALAARGHDVTIYSLFPLDQTAPNLTHVQVTITWPEKLLTYDEFIERYPKTSGFAARHLRSISYTKTEVFLRTDLVQNLLHSKESYDLVITGASFGEEALLVFGHVFNAPTISLMPSAPWNVVNDMAGNDQSIAYIPDYLAYGFTNKMTFFERTQNLLSITASLLIYHWIDLPGQDSLVRRYAGDIKPPPPPVKDMVRDVSLTLCNFHPNIDYARPLPPNIIPVGGIHIKDDNTSLPQDIQDWLDGAEDGVVYFSLGSIVPVASMPKHLLQALVSVFSRLRQRVLWKMPTDVVQELPSNVMAASWLPQQSVLAHPKVVLFVTHGGLGSQLEVLKAGVPVVGVPFFTDQPYNVRLYQQLGVGEPLDLFTLTEQTLETAIHTVLSNHSYMEKAKRMSKIYQDQPVSAATRVVYWCEYVVRHKGARHLRPQAALLPWYQLLLLDVTAAVLAALIIMVVVIWSIVTRIYKCLVKPKTLKYLKKNN